MNEYPPEEGSTGTKSSAGQSFRELIEKTFLIGLGAAAITKDRIQELVDEFVKRGQLSGEEGKEMVERLAARSREEARAALKRADSSLQGVVRELGLVTKRDFEELQLQVRQLEHRVALLEAAEEGRSPDASS
jgi:polyhydroxyalkanoate synthesis regulator phasin